MNAAKPQKKSVFDMLSSMSKTTTEDGSLKVPVSDIEPDPDQPRKVFTDENIDNLAAAIKTVGILQPILVEATGKIPPYKIVDGERRWRAAQRAGLTEVPVFVRGQGDHRQLAQAIANANRKDLTDYETAQMIQRLLDASGDPKRKGARKEIAELLDMTSAQVSRLTAMLEPEWQELIEAGLIVSADALSRFRGCPPELQQELVDEAKASGEPITVLVLKQAKSAAAAEAALLSPSHGDGSIGGKSDDGQGGQSATSGALDVGPSTSPDDNEDQDQDAGGDAGTGDATNSATTTPQRSTSPATGSREKAVSLKMTAERLESLFHYLVDKSSDRLEVKLPADLAVAVIENLGGEVPDSNEQYADRIKDLLDAKLGN